MPVDTVLQLKRQGCAKSSRVSPALRKANAPALVGWEELPFGETQHGPRWVSPIKRLYASLHFARCGPCTVRIKTVSTRAPLRRVRFFGRVLPGQPLHGLMSRSWARRPRHSYKAARPAQYGQSGYRSVRAERRRRAEAVPRPKRKNLPEGRFFGASREVSGLPWSFKWCRHQESNPGPTDYKSVALPTELYRHLWAAIISIFRRL